MSEVIFLPPGSAQKLVREGKLIRVTESKEPRKAFSTYEKAQELFRTNFFGRGAFIRMERKCRDAGIDVVFDFPWGDPPYSEEELRKAAQDKDRGRERIFVVRPDSMLANGRRQPVTIETLWNLFKDKNPFGTTTNIFHDNHWFYTQNFIKEQVKSFWGLPTKDILLDSLNKTWNAQTNLLGSGERRRTAVEAVWDLLFYYAVTGEKLLPERYDWTTTQIAPGNDFRVLVGHKSGELEIIASAPTNSRPNFGVCPQR